MNNSKIICVLNVYLRSQWFEEQLYAILKQSIPPAHIIVWNNNINVDLSKYYNIPNITIINSSKNLGVWGRFFSQYFLLDGDYVCVFDDDTIPENNWFKNCIENIEKYNALLGTIGLFFEKGDKYRTIKRYGWDGVSDNSQLVDIIGHSWFFKKEWTDILIKEVPSINKNFLTCGEDMHLSYVLQKYLHIPTIVPPHPKNNTSLWGANYEKSYKYGGVNSTFESTGIRKFDEVLSYYIVKGFETISNKNQSIKVYNNCLDYFINKIKNKKPFAILRNGDGEYSISKNISIITQDKWKFNSGSILTKHLNDTFNLYNTNVYYGITGYTNSKEICDYYYSTIFNKPNITFANIFVNQNYNKWIDFLNNFNDNCVLISSSINSTRTVGKLNVIEYINVDELLVNNWDDEYNKYFDIMEKLGKKYNNTIFLLSAGPLANIFIHKLYLANSNNIYIDCGSSIDVFNKNKYTRPFQSSVFHQDEINLHFQY